MIKLQEESRNNHRKEEAKTQPCRAFFSEVINYSFSFSSRFRKEENKSSLTIESNRTNIEQDVVKGGNENTGIKRRLDIQIQTKRWKGLPEQIHFVIC